MPEQSTVTETTTALAEELKAKTDAAAKAVTGGGFDDPEFESSLQAAIDKDAGKQPAEPKAGDDKSDATKKAADDTAAKAKLEQKQSDKKEPEHSDDIPAALLGEKPKDEKAQDQSKDQSEADRLKFIEEQTKGMTPKAADRFKKIEARAYEAEQAAKKIQQEREAEKVAVQKQIEELRQKAQAKSDDAELARLKKEIEDRDAIIAKSALQEDPRFKAAFDGQIASEIEKAKKFVSQEKADELAQLLSIPESQKRNDRITEIAEELSEIQRTKLFTSLERIDRLASDKADQLSKWRENKIHVEAEAMRQREVESKKIEEIQMVAWNKGMEAVTSNERGLEVFKKINGEDSWNATVDGRIGEVRKILTDPNLPPEKLVEIAARAVAVDDYRRMFLAQRALVTKLREEIEGLKAAEPNAGEGAGGDSGSGEDSDDFITAAIKGAVKSGGLRA